MAAATKRRVPVLAAPTNERVGRPMRVRIGNLIPSKINPRKTMDEDFVQTIGQQMTDNVQLQPMAARPTDQTGIYEVFIGHTRLAGFNAMLKIGKITADHEADIMVYDVDDREAYIMAIAENVVRRDMPPLQECAAIADALSSGVSIRELSRETGLKPGEINDRIAVTRADEKIRQYVAAGERSIAWVGRFAQLSKTEQYQISGEIDRNPGMYRSVRELNDYARQDKIPVRNAIFDVATSGLAIVHDMMDRSHDWFEDRQAFWDRQNIAIQDRVAELERTGQEVTVLRSKPFLKELWRKTDAPRGAHAFILVSDNGEVQIEDMYLQASAPEGAPIAEDSEDHTTAQNMGFETNDEDAAARVAPQKPAATPTTAPPSQKEGKLSLARMRVDTAALCIIQDPEYAERLLLASYLGDDRLRSTQPAPQIQTKTLFPVSSDIDAQFKIFTATAAKAEAQPLEFALALPIEEVRALNAIALAMRLDNQRGPSIVFPENALARIIMRTHRSNGGRGDFVPNAAFLEAFNISELRALAEELLSADDASYAQTAPLKDLIKLFADRFAEAAENNPMLDPSIAFRLNTWWPSYL